MTDLLEALAAVRDRLLVAITHLQHGNFDEAADEIEDASSRLDSASKELRP